MIQAHPDTRTLPSGKGDRTRRHILDTAAKVLASAGTVDVKLTDIARAAGLKPGSLYFHFDSRDDLVAEVLTAGMDQALAHLEEALATAGTSASDRLRAAISAHLNARLELNDYAAVVLGTRRRTAGSYGEKYERQRRRYIRSWLDLITAVQAAGEFPADLDPRLICDLMLGALNTELGARYGSADAARTFAALIGLS